MCLETVRKNSSENKRGDAEFLTKKIKYFGSYSRYPRHSNKGPPLLQSFWPSSWMKPEKMLTSKFCLYNDQRSKKN